MNDLRQDTDGVDVKIFSRFRNVFSGHYHNRHKIENVQYIGSPMQQSFSEKSQEKGVLLYDDESLKTEFIPIKMTPKHYDVIYDCDSGEMSVHEDVTEIDFVRVKVVGRSEKVSLFKREHFTIGCREVKIDRDVRSEVVSRLTIGTGESENLESLIGKYVEFVNPALDHKKLISVGRSFVGATL